MRSKWMNNTKEFFENINKFDNPLAILIKTRKENTQINTISDGNGRLLQIPMKHRESSVNTLKTYSE